MFKIEKVVIASRNNAKVDHFRNVLSGLVDKVIGQSNLQIQGKPDEVGKTAEENAQIKARFYAQKTCLPVFAEDESLFVDFLPPEQQPGTHVRRIKGKDEVSDDELFAYWENIIKNVPEDKRTGHWHIAYCLAINGKIKVVTQNIAVRFYYPASIIRTPGWPLSSLQGSRGKPHSEYTKEENRQSVERDAKIILNIFKQLLDNDGKLS
jgi:inosine/xanthosine triphosphate pyrophosphatase family protein